MTGTSVIPIIVVAIVSMRKRKVISSFKISDTTTEKNAKTITELKISTRLFFRRLVNRGVIVDVDGKYYQDEQNPKNTMPKED